MTLWSVAVAPLYLAGAFTVEEGSMPWGASLAGVVSRFALLRGALNESAAMRDALADVSFGDHADSVDGMPAFEYYRSRARRGGGNGRDRRRPGHGAADGLCERALRRVPVGNDMVQ